MKNKKIIILVWLSLFGMLHAQEMSDREKQNQINYLFKMGTECYYQGKYSQAIKYWEAVLDIDPQQTQPPALIENARDQVQKESGPLYEKMGKAIEQGQYLEAQEQTLKLLDLDPANKDYKTIMEKLKKIVPIFTSLPQNKQIARLVKESVDVYVIDTSDIDAAFLSIQYALQQDASHVGMKKYYDVLKKDYPAVARKHAAIEGINMLDQILQNSLQFIYEGNYVGAITECNRALKLDPHNLLALKRLGSAYFALGNKTKAYAIWGEAQKISPNDKELEKFLKAK